MTELYKWGIEVITAIQTISSPFLTVIIRFITSFSGEVFFIFVLALLFWAGDKSKGAKIAFLILLSAAVNIILKNTLQVLRPYQQDPSVFIITEKGFSTPSGHSQFAATFWPYFSYLYLKNKKALGITLSITIPIIIGFTRIYLGVHFPTDVLLGLVLGYLFSTGAILFTKDISIQYNKLPRILKILFFALIAFTFNYLCPADTSINGVFFGFGLGYVFLNEKTSFEGKNGKWHQKVLRLLLGIGILAIIYLGLKLIGPGADSDYYHLYRFFRYGVIGILSSFVLPVFFVTLHLVPEKPNTYSESKESV